MHVNYRWITLFFIMIFLLASSQSWAANEIKRDGQFIAYDDGTVLDTKTNLMWAAKDNGNNINWIDAKSYCEKYRGGGYENWRMPTDDELLTLYDEGKSRTINQQNCSVQPYYDKSCNLQVSEVDTDKSCKTIQWRCNIYVTELIQLNECCYWSYNPWSYEKRTNSFSASIFRFDNGLSLLVDTSFLKHTILRVLPVRSVKNVRYVWLGAAIGNITPIRKGALKLKDSKGAVVSNVFRESPAFKAGIKSGDIIIEINNHKINNYKEIIRIITSLNKGDKAIIKVRRDGVDITVPVIIEELNL